MSEQLSPEQVKALEWADDHFFPKIEDLTPEELAKEEQWAIESFKEIDMIPPF
ncbi:hypothetical protein NEA10_20705 (plasmid) [Phormidium yuhuli AB48]|jgi:hypothetical protein|uniref:Uncharacterized protein n=1 Tax=Phormidium yuhuli AB48 TaxID=2940671 RepID=A0ABY5AVI4_9CYAN|nr:hypothetical protein [Phormidium yuhuli]USR93267.1 hypothetical protein NEA10_20705 [Phormidium yuhuli AB48]